MEVAQWTKRLVPVASPAILQTGTPAVIVAILILIALYPSSMDVPAWLKYTGTAVAALCVTYAAFYFASGGGGLGSNLNYDTLNTPDKSGKSDANNEPSDITDENEKE